MRLSDVDICNQAIGLCGSTDWIQSLDDNSVSARRCKRFFEPAVERVLRKHNWSSATVIVELAQNTTDPVAEWDNAFALPADCVKVVNVYSDVEGYNPYDRWRIVKRNVHTDISQVYLKYVQFPEDYKDLDTLLSNAIAYELATLLAPTLLKNPEMYSILKQASRLELAQAKAMDSLENKDLYVENDVWEDARLSVNGNQQLRRVR